MCPEGLLLGKTLVLPVIPMVTLLFLTIKKNLLIAFYFFDFSVIPDRSIKVLELGKLIKRLPKTNFAVLKFIFQHFVK